MAGKFLILLQSTYFACGQPQLDTNPFAAFEGQPIQLGGGNQLQ